MAKVRKRVRRSNVPKGAPIFRPGTPQECPSRWNFWEEGITSSMLSLFLTCREQLRLSAVCGWRGYSTPMAISFGTCIHWCLEQQYATKKKPTAAGIRKLVQTFEKLWNAERPNPPKNAREQQEHVYLLAESVLPSYFERWAGDFPGEKYPVKTSHPPINSWLGLETKFSVPFTYPDGTKTVIRGTRDALFESKKNQIWGFDTKCYSMINENDIMDTLPFNLQQMLYLWATWKETGKVPSGVVMNIVRRPGHRQLVQETLKDLGKKIVDDVSKPNRWDHFFIRIYMEITKGEIQEWHDTVLLPLMEDVRLWWSGVGPHYMNPNALVSKYGRCEMFNAIVYNDYGPYYQKGFGEILNYQTEIT